MQTTIFVHTAQGKISILNAFSVFILYHGVVCNTCKVVKNLSAFPAWRSKIKSNLKTSGSILTILPFRSYSMFVVDFILNPSEV